MLASSLIPVGRCTTDDSPAERPPARNLPRSTPVSNTNSLLSPATNLNPETSAAPRELWVDVTRAVAARTALIQGTIFIVVVTAVNFRRSFETQPPSEEGSLTSPLLK